MSQITNINGGLPIDNSTNNIEKTNIEEKQANSIWLKEDNDNKFTAKDLQSNNAEMQAVAIKALKSLFNKPMEKVRSYVEAVLYNIQTQFQKNGKMAVNETGLIGKTIEEASLNQQGESIGTIKGNKVIYRGIIAEDTNNDGNIDRVIDGSNPIEVDNNHDGKIDEMGSGATAETDAVVTDLGYGAKDFNGISYDMDGDGFFEAYDTDKDGIIDAYDLDGDYELDK